jgi:UDP-N-acetylglucosamine transferase subunit ALG13
MIFVTVGEQLPFDRLIRTVDEWSASSVKEVFAQIGRTDWKPSHIDYKEFLGPEEYRRKFQDAEIIIAHAGMGTIISALELNKPILLMPRREIFREVRNEHQISTARRFMTLNYVSVAFDEAELRKKLGNLDKIIKNQREKRSIGASPSLITTIREFIMDQ